MRKLTQSPPSLWFVRIFIRFLSADLELSSHILRRYSHWHLCVSIIWRDPEGVFKLKFFAIKLLYVTNCESHITKPRFSQTAVFQILFLWRYTALGTLLLYLPLGRLQHLLLGFAAINMLKLLICTCNGDTFYLWSIDYCLQAWATKTINDKCRHVDWNFWTESYMPRKIEGTFWRLDCIA